MSNRAGPVEIVEASPDVWPGLAALFEEGGDPRWCWCQFWRTRGSDSGRSTAERNREALQGLVARQPAPGLVAVEPDGRVVGLAGLGPPRVVGLAQAADGGARTG